jgi:hypothetical protein
LSISPTIGLCARRHGWDLGETTVEVVYDMLGIKQRAEQLAEPRS